MLWTSRDASASFSSWDSMLGDSGRYRSRHWSMYCETRGRKICCDQKNIFPMMRQNWMESQILVTQPLQILCIFCMMLKWGDNQALGSYMFSVLNINDFRICKPNCHTGTNNRDSD